MNAVWLITGVILSLLLAGFLSRQAKRIRGASGLPSGEVVYADTASWQKVHHPLRSRRYRLSGKPDYLIYHEDMLIPVEVKTSYLPANGRPYASHRLQLLAYCLLVEERMGQTPPYGIIHYVGEPGGDVRVLFDEAARSQLLATMDAMRAAAGRDDVPRSHNNPRRCQQCGLRHVCGQSLA